MAGNLVALDIGSSQVKLVWYAGTTRKKAVAADLPDRMVANGGIVSMDAMADFLRDTARRNGIPRTNAAVILPASQVFTRNVDVPAMTDAQLAYNLPFEFKDYLTQEKSRYYFDYAVQSLVKDASGAVRQMRLFACAALKSTIEDYRAMLRRAGFRLKSAIPEEAAYAALLAGYQKRASAAPADYCFVDLGFNAIRMQILHDDVFMMRRTVDLGLFDLVRSLSETRGVDEHMALEHLRSDYEGALDDAASQELYHRMAVEIMKAVNFYNYNNREQTLQRIYLCGGGAAVGQIRAAITELTNLDIRPVAELLPDGAALEQPWLCAKAIGCALQA